MFFPPHRCANGSSFMGAWSGNGIKNVSQFPAKVKSPPTLWERKCIKMYKSGCILQFTNDPMYINCWLRNHNNCKEQTEKPNIFCIFRILWRAVVSKVKFKINFIAVLCNQQNESASESLFLTQIMWSTMKCKVFNFYNSSHYELLGLTLKASANLLLILTLRGLCD